MLKLAKNSEMPFGILVTASVICFQAPESHVLNDYAIRQCRRRFIVGSMSLRYGQYAGNISAKQPYG